FFVLKNSAAAPDPSNTAIRLLHTALKFTHATRAHRFLKFRFRRLAILWNYMFEQRLARRCHSAGAMSENLHVASGAVHLACDQIHVPSADTCCVQRQIHAFFALSKSLFRALVLD